MKGKLIALGLGGLVLGLIIGSLGTRWSIERAAARAGQESPMSATSRPATKNVVPETLSVSLPVTPKPAFTVELQADGLSLYQGRGTCFICHGEKGRGDGESAYRFNPPPTDLTKGAWLRFPSDEDRFRVIKGGIPKTGMMAFGESSQVNLSDADIWALVAYLKYIER